MRSETEEYRSLWQHRISECRKAGISQAEYCRRNNLKPYVFTYWKSKLGSKYGANSMIEIPVTPITSRDPQSTIFEMRLTESLNFSLSLRISFRILDTLRGMSRVSGN